MVSFMTLAFVNLDISGGGRNPPPPPPAQLTPQKPGMNRVYKQVFQNFRMCFKYTGLFIVT